MPRPNINDSRSNAPPPPERAGGGLFSTTVADAVADFPLTADVQVSVNVRVTDGVAGTNASVAVALPFVAREPGQASFGPPPVASQVVAFVELHVRVVDCPATIVLGEAERDAVTSGQLTTTDVSAVALCKSAMQVNPNV
jgi:hypothetical protein